MLKLGRLLLGKLLMVLVAVSCPMGAAVGQTANYAGTYGGTYTGIDQGTWTATISSSGAVVLTGTSTLSGDAFSGNNMISSNGALVVSVGNSTTTGSTFSGNINATSGNVSGTWNNVQAGAGGTFSGSRTSATTTTTTALATTTTTTTAPGTTTTTTVGSTTTTTQALAGVPAVNLSPASLTFASQKVGAVSASQAITLTNTGGASLAIGNIEATGDYVTATTCGPTLAAGASCGINVIFVATYPGARSGNLAIRSNAAGSPHLVPISGTAAYTVLSYPLQLEPGWNLLGNSINKILNVGRIFGDPAVVASVWKWNTRTSSWQFYTPSMTAAALQSYAVGKGYGVLSDINPGEGYWVNAKVRATLASPTAAAFERTADNLVTGWNLVGTGDDVSPSVFNSSLAAVTPAVSMTSLWAWDSVLLQWYFYAPSLEAQGGSALANYIAGKGYLDFTTQNKTLGKGTGFWVNSTSSNTSPPVTISGIVAMGWPFGNDNQLKRDDQGRDYVDNGDRVIYCNGYSQLTGAYVPCTEVNSDGRFSLLQSAKDIGNFIRGKAEGTWIGKQVTRISISANNGLETITNNVNHLTDLVAKGYSKITSGKTELPPDSAPVDQGKWATAWQGVKKVLGSLGTNLGSDPSSDALFAADPSADPRDKVLEQINARDDGAGNAVIDDKNGKNMATVALEMVGNNTAAGDAETVTQIEADAAKAAADRMTEIQLQLTAYQGFFATGRPSATDPALAALFDATFLQDGQDKQTFVASLPDRTQPATGATIKGELADAPLGKVSNDATHQWINLGISQSGGGVVELWLTIKDGGTGKWLLAGNQLGGTHITNTLSFSAPVFDIVSSANYAGTVFSYVSQPGQSVAPPAFSPVTSAPPPITTSYYDVSFYAFLKPWPRCRYSLNTLNQDQFLTCELDQLSVNCWIKGPTDPNQTYTKTCASLNVTFNRTAGTLTFSATPLHDIGTKLADSATLPSVNTVGGSLNFAPF